MIMELPIERPFHSRIFRFYISYLEKRLGWTPLRIDHFLSELSMTRARLEDESSWFSVEFADLFYEKLSQQTGDPQLAYKAGRYVSEISANPMIHKLISGLMDVSFVYKLLTRFSGHFTKAAKFNIVSVSANAAEVESIPLHSFKERPYMCENRRGMLEGIPEVFGLSPAELTETECLHQGGKKCLYQLRWQSKSSHKDLLLAGASYVVAFGIGFAIDLSWAFFLSSSAMLLSVALWSKKRFDEQKKELLTQNEALDHTLKEIERRNQQLQLIGQVSQLTNSLMPPEVLSKTITRQVCELLGYDRCILLLTDFEKNLLKVSAHFGFDAQVETLISQTEFNLSSGNSAGFFVKVVNTKAPLLISDIEQNIQVLSARSQKFAKMLGTKSFVAVPLMDEAEQVLGVLSVDNIQPEKQITISDQDLLMTLAQHLGIALHNSKLVKQLEDNLEISQNLSRDEKILREVFQKFVPQDLSLDLASAAKLGQSGKRLSQVRKKTVGLMFLDVGNFSALAEGLEAEEAVELLNIAFSVFEPIVHRQSGYVDKFLGDGFLAVFESGEALERACLAAVESIRAMEDINNALKSKGYPGITIGIGINYGPVILGNIGSEHRLNFTAIGEPVNLASRLQEYTRRLGPNTICVSQAVVERLKANLFSLRNVGSVTLKGYVDPVPVFELLESLGVEQKISQFIRQDS